MQRTTRRRRKRHGPDRRTVIQDVASFILAWALIWYLAIHGVNAPIQWGLLGLAGGLLGVPVTGEIGRRLRPGTGGRDSRSASSDFVPSSRSSLPHNEATGEITPPMI